MVHFDDLSGHDFELLVADLLSRELPYELTSFREGVDGAVDLVGDMQPGLHYVQCKRYIHSDFTKLVRAAEEQHAAMQAHSPHPARYTFVTSFKLTRAKKQKLMAALGPLVSDERDVLGAEDLEKRLRRHPAVERAHIKLWLSSVVPLERIVHADVWARQAAMIEDIVSELPRYVQTGSFDEAREILDAHKVILIAGAPGLGKTTLARMLVLNSMRGGYKPYFVHSNLTDAWRRFGDEQRVFFFDDFLGRTALSEGVQCDPRDLASFIGEVRRRENARLILTTRKYILQQALQEFEEMRWRELDAKKYLLTVDSYTRIERARILYNHLYFSRQLDASTRAELLRDETYLKVIDHPAYSPRLIEWMTGRGYELEGATQDGFAGFCLSVLESPQTVWSHAYEQGLSERERCLLLTLPGLPSDAPLSDVEACFMRSARARGLPCSPSEFASSLSVLHESFVRSGHTNASADGSAVEPVRTVSVLNPSLIDFLRLRLEENPRGLSLVLAGAYHFGQVDFLAEVACSDSVPMDTELVRALVDATQRTLGNAERDVDEVAYREKASCLRHAARWCERAPALLEPLEPLLRDATATLIGLLPDQGIDVLADWVSLLESLGKAGFAIDGLSAQVKEHALAFIEQGEMMLRPLESLAALRSASHSSFNEAEWENLRELFESWAEEGFRCAHFREATGEYHDHESVYHAEIDTLERVERLARTMCIELDPGNVRAYRQSTADSYRHRESKCEGFNGTFPALEEDGEFALDPAFGAGTNAQATECNAPIVAMFRELA